MKKALITGISGFVGPHLKHELEKNSYEVFGLGKSKSSDKNYFQADITDKNQLNSIIQKIQPTHIFHLAGVSSPRLAKNNPELTMLVNVQGTENLFQSVLNLEEKPRVFVAGSSHVYGIPQYLPIDERHPVEGKGPYNKSKAEQEKLINEYAKKFFIVGSRSFNHTGPGQTDVFVVPKIIKQIIEIKQNKRESLEMGNINLKRDFCDVRDVVCAYRLLIEQEKNEVLANVCRGESISLEKIITIAKDLADLDNIDIQVNQAFVSKNDIVDIYGDNSFLKSLVDWDVKISYKNMIKDIYNNLNKNYMA